MLGNRLTAISIFVILIGLAITYVLSDLKLIDVWAKCFYVWDKIKDLLLIASIYYLCKDKLLCKCLKATWFFLLLRLLWEIIPNYQIAGQLKIMDILLFFDVVVILYIIFIYYKPKLTRFASWNYRK